MNYYNIISPQPVYKTCGKLMKEWNPFADDHEHIECCSERISKELINKIREMFKKTKEEINK